METRLARLEEAVSQMRQSLSDMALELRDIRDAYNQLLGVVGILKWFGYTGIAGVIVVVGKVLVTKGAP